MIKQTSRYSSIIHTVAIPIATALFVLVYRPFNIYPFLDLSAGLFYANLLVLMGIALITTALLRGILYFKLKSKIDSTAKYILWCIIESVITGTILSLFVYFIESHILKSSGIAPFVLPAYLALSLLPYIITYMAIELHNSKDSTETEETKNCTIVKEGMLISFCGSTNESKIDILAEDIVYINSVENYVHIHYINGTENSSTSIRATMNSIENTVAVCKQIRRAHRSYIINIMYLERVVKDKRGNFFAILKDGSELPVSKKYYEHFICEVPPAKISLN